MRFRRITPHPMKRFRPLVVLLLALEIAWGQTVKLRKTDAEIKQAIIKESHRELPRSLSVQHRPRRSKVRRTQCLRSAQWLFADLLRARCDAENGRGLSQEDWAINGPAFKPPNPR